MENSFFKLELIGSKDCLWRYTVKSTQESFDIAPPRFEIEAKIILATFNNIHIVKDPVELTNGVTEFRYTATLKENKNLQLSLIFWMTPDSPVVRFRYELASHIPLHLTKQNELDAIIYAGLALDEGYTLKEIRLSEFDEAIHSFVF